MTFATAVANPATGQVEIWDDFMGAPSVYFVWSVPQDGIAKPQDFNASASRLLRNLWNVPACRRNADRSGRERVLHRHADGLDGADNAVRC